MCNNNNNNNNNNGSPIKHTPNLPCGPQSGLIISIRQKFIFKNIPGEFEY